MSSIDYDYLLANAYYNEASLIEAVEGYFSCKVRVAERFDSTVYMEAYSGDEFLFGVYLIGCAAGHAWESNITGGEFRYQQKVIIALDKENAGMDMVAKVIGFFIELSRKDRQEVLVKSDVHDDIFYIFLHI